MARTIIAHALCSKKACNHPCAVTRKDDRRARLGEPPLARAQCCNPSTMLREEKTVCGCGNAHANAAWARYGGRDHSEQFKTIPLPCPQKRGTWQLPPFKGLCTTTGQSVRPNGGRGTWLQFGSKGMRGREKPAESWSQSGAN